MNDVDVTVCQRKAVQIAEMLKPFSEEERALIIGELPYCKHCWRDLPTGTCQCWNDE